MKRLIFLFSCVLGAGAAAAEPVRLEGSALKEAVTGSVVAIDTPLGTTVPIRFGNDGMVSGEAGDLAGLLGSPKDRGRWWIADNKVCAKWFRWFEAQPHCLVIRLEGTRIFWQKDDGETGTATLVSMGDKGGTPKPSTPATTVAEAAEPPSKAQALGGPVPERTSEPGPQKFVTAGVAPAAPVPITQEARPDGATEPRTSASAQPQSLYPVRENLLPTRRITEPKAKPVQPAPVHAAPVHAAPVQAAPLQAERRAPAPAQAERARVAQSASSVLRAQQPEPLGQRPLAASFRVAGVQDYDVLYIRNGPSREHESVGMIPPTGRGIVITGRCQDDWCPIRHRSVSGWVNRYYLAQEMPR